MKVIAAAVCACAMLTLAGCSDTPESKQDSAKAACVSAVQQKLDVSSDDIIADMSVANSGSDGWILIGTVRGKNAPYRCEAKWDDSAKQARATVTVG